MVCLLQRSKRNMSISPMCNTAITKLPRSFYFSHLFAHRQSHSIITAREYTFRASTLYASLVACKFCSDCTVAILLSKKDITDSCPSIHSIPRRITIHRWSCEIYGPPSIILICNDCLLSSWLRYGICIQAQLLVINVCLLVFCDAFLLLYCVRSFVSWVAYERPLLSVWWISVNLVLLIVPIRSQK
jgi:hypothetical protein